METRIDEIAPDIYRLSTWVDEIAPPAGFTFNQFLVRDEQPFLFHTGMRALFPLVSEAVARIVPLADLRWIAFAHVEADECGAMNQFLAAAPQAEVIHGELACMVSLNDMADRPPRPMADGEVARPRHAPAAVPADAPRSAQLGERALVRRDDLHAVRRRPVHPRRRRTGGDHRERRHAAIGAEAIFHATSCGPDLVPTLRPPRRPRPDDARADARLVVLGRRVGRAPGLRGGVRIGRSRPRRRVDPAPLLATIGDRKGRRSSPKPVGFRKGVRARRRRRALRRAVRARRATGRRSTSSDASRCRDAATRAQVSTDRRTARTQPKRPSSAR